jgi:hypothetical protein
MDMSQIFTIRQFMAVNLFGYIPRRLRRINNIYCYYDTPPLWAGLFIASSGMAAIVIPAVPVFGPPIPGLHPDTRAIA